jgi:hypothetical protein
LAGSTGPTDWAETEAARARIAAATENFIIMCVCCFEGELGLSEE